MPADLDQFRREDSHRAVIRGIGLVQLGHVPADGRCFLNQVDLESGRRQIKGRLDSADPAADNHHVAEIAFDQTLAQLLYLLFQ